MSEKAETPGETKEKTKEKKTIYRPAGTIGHLVYESVFYEGAPAFLVLDKEGFKIVSRLETGREVFLPLEHGMFPYRPYSLTKETLSQLSQWAPNKTEVYKEVFQEFETFYDVDTIYRLLESTATLLSYHQHKVMSVPYLFAYGPTDSGKTNRCLLHYYLCYRPLFSASLPSADIYTYFGHHEEGLGTIIEDEAHKIEKDIEKIKIHLLGYKKGATVPRVSFTPSGKRIQDFFHCFGLRLFAGRRLFKDDALLERCILYPTMRGFPKKDEFTEEDIERFDRIRLKLLFWRMKTYFEPLPVINPPFGGRLKELWKPLLQMSYGLNAYNYLLDLAKKDLSEKLEEAKSELDYWVAKAVIRAFVEQKGGVLPFGMIWGYLIEGLEGTVIDENRMTCEAFGEITKSRVGYRLGKKGILKGEKQTKRHTGEVTKVYSFDRDWLVRVAKGYGFTEYVTELLKLPSSKTPIEPKKP